MSEIILDMWLYTHHMSALLAKKSDNINKVSPILLPLQTLHIKSTTNRESNFDSQPLSISGSAGVGGLGTENVIQHKVEK